MPNDPLSTETPEQMFRRAVTALDAGRADPARLLGVAGQHVEKYAHHSRNELLRGALSNKELEPWRP